MPLVRIDLRAGKTPAYKKALGLRHEDIFINRVEVVTEN